MKLRSQGCTVLTEAVYCVVKNKSGVILDKETRAREVGERERDIDRERRNRARGWGERERERERDGEGIN